jgi:hypothetical protein
MPIITDAITYNVRERGRKARGQDRNFDTVALAKLINSAGIQEKVKHGDMFGYFGHWPRIKFGMEPAEGGIIDGKVVPVPTALRTIELSADNEGNITHRAEFLDTNEGRIAARLFESKAGGFSSAIMSVPGTSPAIPSGFYGFDYVLEPNYTTNRGHKVVLDGAAGEEEQAAFMEMLDSVMGEATQAASLINTLFDSLQAQHALALETLGRMQTENEELMAMLAKGSHVAVMDSAGGAFVKPVRSVVPEFDHWRSATLAPLPVFVENKPQEPSPEMDYARSRFGVKG